MKKASITLALLGAAAFVHAEELIMIAGWDFSQYAGTNFNVIANDGVFVNKLSANYSDYDPTFGAGAESADYGTMYWDGSFGSTNGKATNPADAIPFSGSLNENSDPTAGLAFDAHPTLDTEGQVFTNFLSFTVRDTFGGGDGDLVFEATPDEPHGEWEIRFAGKLNGDGDAVAAVLFSADGLNYSQIGTATFTSVEQFYIYSVTGNASGAGYFMLDFTDIDSTGDPVIDNVSIHGTVGGSVSTTYWPDSPVLANGWKISGSGYPDEFGIGLIVDGDWPFVYSLAMQSWLYFAPGYDRTGFWAYNFSDGYWFHGLGQWGWYYIPEGEAWAPFDL